MKAQIRVPKGVGIIGDNPIDQKARNVMCVPPGEDAIIKKIMMNVQNIIVLNMGNLPLVVMSDIGRVVKPHKATGVIGPGLIIHMQTKDPGAQLLITKSKLVLILLVLLILVRIFATGGPIVELAYVQML